MNIKSTWNALTQRLNAAGQWLPNLLIRMILFWEFYEAGTQKLNGENWFADIAEKFPFPFNHFSVEFSWFMAAWGEYLFSIMLLLGLFTRFAAVSLLVITAVATAAVHWPASYDSLGQLWEGYAISYSAAGNYKLPLLFVILLMPLVFNGAGKFSLDHLLRKFTGTTGGEQRVSDLASWGLTALVLGLTLNFVMPVLGIALLVIGAGLVGYQVVQNR